MKSRKYLILFISLFILTIFFLINTALGGEIFLKKSSEPREIVKIFNKRFFKNKLKKGSYWVSLPERLSSKKITPIVILLHGGVFNNADHSFIFSRIFNNVYKNHNVILAAPKMPLKSYPRWRNRDVAFIKSVIKSVKRDYGLNPANPVFLGGFSNGAEFALKLVLGKHIETNGVFAFAGGCRLVWNKINKKIDRSLPIFLSAGHRDGNWLGSSVASYRHLKSKNFSNVTIVGYAGLEHWIGRKQVYRLLKWINKNDNT